MCIPCTRSVFAQIKGCKHFQHTLASKSYLKYYNNKTTLVFIINIYCYICGQINHSRISTWASIIVGNAEGFPVMKYIEWYLSDQSLATFLP